MKMSPEYMADLHMFLFKNTGDITALKGRAAEHIKYIPRKKLYRYRKYSEREISILRQNKIWLASPSSFPDMFDATIPMQDDTYVDFWYSAFFTFELAYIAIEKVGTPNGQIPDKEWFFHELMEVMKAYTPEEIAAEAKSLLGDDLYKKSHEIFIPNEIIQSKIEMLTSFLKDLSVSPRHSLAITSFSAKKDNRNLWENYADYYTGFCIEYDLSKAMSDSSSKGAWDILHILPISYCAKRPVFDSTSLLRRIVQAELKISKLSLGDDFLQQYYRAITAKQYDYRAEDEWRIILSEAYIGEYGFPYISNLIIGKDMSEDNIQVMRKVASELSVPLLKQTLSADRTTFTYSPCK